VFKHFLDNFILTKHEVMIKRDVSKLLR